MGNIINDTRKGTDVATEILNRNSEIRNQTIGTENRKYDYDLEKDQPYNISWAVVDVNAGNIAIDDWSMICYKNAKVMKKELLMWVDQMITVDLLELIRDGDLTNLCLHIGPNPPSGDINEFNGIHQNQK